MIKKLSLEPLMFELSLSKREGNTMIVNKNRKKFVRSRHDFGVVVVLFFLCQTLGCWGFDEEGLALLKLREKVINDPFDALSDWKNDGGEFDHCSWFGVQCSHGKVVLLNLKNLCLEGTLAPELGNLAHIKSINLRNNSFSGKIPEEIGELKELEVLDLGYNNFTGPIPPQRGINQSLTILNLGQSEDEAQRRLLGKMPATPENSPKPHFLTINISSHAHKVPTTPASSERSLNRTSTRDAPRKRRSSTLTPSPSENKASPNTYAPSMSSYHSSSHHRIAILAGAVGGTVCLLMLIVIAYLFKISKVSTVKPWKTGLSGQLQKAFVTGVPKLKRSELEAACEDFSNVIGSSTIVTVYKGTLSSGVEIAVASFLMKSAKDWSKNLESEFRKKIETLSKVNHKNFVNLLGYCEESQPFTRMMVFEYASNGTLFEHLHIEESEHLDWMMRLRIIMGMTYCLEHMHHLKPPVPHKNLSSSAINLTEDYAAKISDLSFSNEVAAPPRLESNVFMFGVLLFEMVTGRMPYTMDNESLEQPLIEMVDPTLKSFDRKQVEDIGEVINACVRPEPGTRPNIREVSARLREITAITPDGAMPKLSPLWWAELEIMSAEPC